jgi:hypothetical protein
MSASWIERFQKVAPILESLRTDPGARLNYELMSDALVWSDELPVPSEFEKYDVDVACVRGIFRYRTSLICGNPEERFRSHWEEANRLCPNWPGLLANRRSAEPGRIEFFEKRRKELFEQWEALDVEFERRKAMTAPIANGANGELASRDNGQKVAQEDFHR